MTEQEVKEKIFNRIAFLTDNSSASDLETLSIAFDRIAKTGKEDVQAKYLTKMMDVLSDMANFKPVSPWENTPTGLGIVGPTEIKENDISGISE